MTIAYRWLKEYVDVPESPEDLAKILTSTGLEVEHVVSFQSVKGGLSGLVVGEVVSCEKHPNADKLSVTKVDVGSGEPRQIVCGAPNVAKGQKVIVALPGTMLHPFKGGAFTIKSTRIRGEQSEGMICAEDEIGLGHDHEGIIVLDPRVKTGTPAADVCGVTDDYAIEIGLTPNRADAVSHIGVARDVAASKSRTVRWPSIEEFKIDSRALSVKVVVEDTKACPRYSALTISGVSVKPSPSWLQNRLRSIGLAPINNVVDVTNFVMHEMGQPLHAFDVEAIEGKKVIVKTLPEGTTFLALDNKERKLLSTDLMICHAGSENAGMCIAGVFGGIRSGVKDGTKDIFLESAHFSPDYVRRTSQHHQLKTDASFRFERGTDPRITVTALKRAALLIKQVAGGTISSEIVDLYPSEIENRVIKVKEKNVNRLIGKIISRTEILSILSRLDITTVSQDDESFTVSVPPYRVDVTQEADIVEEILRIYGLNNIELSNRAQSEYLAEFPVKNIDRYRRTIGELLASNGFNEIWTNSLTNQAYQQRFELTFDGEPVEILNKLSEEQGMLRQTMLFTGLEVCAYNLNRKQRDLRLFEFGKIYGKKNDKYFEKERLALYMGGSVEAENWQQSSVPVGYHNIAQQLHNIFYKSGIEGVRQAKADEHQYDFQVSFILKGQELGRVGKVKSAVLKHFGIRQEIFFAELDTTLLFQLSNPKLVIQEIPKFPEVRRDLSLVLDGPVSFDEIERLALDTEKRLIKDVGVFDVYQGENLPGGKKAYALSFILQDMQKTLTDDEIDKTMQRLIAAFEQQLGATIRK